VFDNRKVNGILAPMDERTCRFGQRPTNKICSHGNDGPGPAQQYQRRGQYGATAHAGQADQYPNHETQN
jgi:hypothetical protein